MTMTPRTIADAAVRHARRGHYDLRTTTTATGAAVIDPGDGRGTLAITKAMAGYLLLFHERPGGGGRQAILAEADAVEAAAAWIDGEDLPPTSPPDPTPEAVDLYDRVWDAVMAALPEGLADADYPGGSYGVEDMIIGGSEGAHLAVTPRLDDDGTITGAAWAGQRADGSAITGHGTVEGVLAAATDWGSSLADHPVISGAEAQARREATGASQTDLARLMSVGQNAISRWESGSRAPRDPHTYLAAVAELEALADDLYEQALADGKVGGQLPVWRTDRAYWEAVPTAAQQGTPAAMHRVATARAVHTLRTQGVEMRIVAGEDRF